MFRMRRIEKKIDLLVARQNFLASILFYCLLTHEVAKKQEKKWNKLWYEIMEDGHGKRK